MNKKKNCSERSTAIGLTQLSIESLNSDVQQFHQYQQNKQLHISSNLKKKNTYRDDLKLKCIKLEV